jgi:hypothetical protein
VVFGIKMLLRECTCCDTRMQLMGLNVERCVVPVN